MMSAPADKLALQHLYPPVPRDGTHRSICSRTMGVAFRHPASLLVARLDVRYAQVHEGRDRVVELVFHDRDVRLVGSGGTARVHELESLTMHGFSSRTTWPPRTSE